jgi:hypothetical protein
MKTHLTVALVLSLIAVSVSAQEVLRREGQDWILESSGSVPVPAMGVVTVKTTGGVIVRGGSANRVSYLLRTRVQARSEAEARRLLRGVVLRALNRSTSLDFVLGPTRADLSSDVEIQAPSALKRLLIHTGGGNISTANIAGNVEAQTAGGVLQIDRIGGDLFARTGGGEIHLGRIEGGVKCFSGAGSINVERCGGESWFETAGGEITVKETGSPVHCSTAGGSIRVERAASSVTAHTGAGRIDVLNAGGVVMAENSGGSIQVGSAQSVRCESSGGAIRLKNVTGSLRAITDVGSILAELIPGLKLQNSTLTSGTGDITVLIPSNLPLTVRAQCDSGRSGRIISDFPEILVKLISVQRNSSLTAEGALNGGGPLLQISANNGVIYLRRQR